MKESGCCVCSGCAWLLFTAKKSGFEGFGFCDGYPGRLRQRRRLPTVADMIDQN